MEEARWFTGIGKPLASPHLFSCIRWVLVDILPANGTTPPPWVVLGPLIPATHPWGKEVVVGVGESPTTHYVHRLGEGGSLGLPAPSATTSTKLEEVVARIGSHATTFARRVGCKELPHKHESLRDYLYNL